jgi:hypothetical protein
MRDYHYDHIHLRSPDPDATIETPPPLAGGGLGEGSRHTYQG